MSGSGYGKTVIDGEIQYLSPSGMSKGDHDQPGGCLRLWHGKYVLGKKEPFTKQQKVGVEAHSQIEHYLNTGEKKLARLTMSASHLIPEPDVSMQVEHKIQPGELFVEGIRVVGHIDLVNPTGLYMSADGVLTQDPKGTVEMLDWKTTSNIEKWAKKGHTLIKTIQMPLYGQWAAEQFEAEHVRLSHVYMQTKGTPCAEKMTALVSRENLAKRWVEIEAIARTG